MKNITSTWIILIIIAMGIGLGMGLGIGRSLYEDVPCKDVPVIQYLKCPSWKTICMEKGGIPFDAEKTLFMTTESKCEFPLPNNP